MALVVGTFRGEALLSETTNTSILAALAIRAPTGSLNAGDGDTSTGPQIQFWQSFALPKIPGSSPESRFRCSRRGTRILACISCWSGDGEGERTLFSEILGAPVSICHL
jgi:hypothetical protein